MPRADSQPDDVLVEADREPSTGPASTSGGGNDVLAQQSRTLRNSLLSLTVFFGLVVGLLLSVPGLSAAADRISPASVSWILVGVAFEILACVGYVVLFGLVFGRLSS